MSKCQLHMTSWSPIAFTMFRSTCLEWAHHCHSNYWFLYSLTLWMVPLFTKVRNLEVRCFALSLTPPYNLQLYCPNISKATHLWPLHCQHLGPIIHYLPPESLQQFPSPSLTFTLSLFNSSSASDLSEGQIFYKIAFAVLKLKSKLFTMVLKSLCCLSGTKIAKQISHLSTSSKFCPHIMLIDSLQFPENAMCSWSQAFRRAELVLSKTLQITIPSFGKLPLSQLRCHFLQEALPDTPPSNLDLVSPVYIFITPYLSQLSYVSCCL